MSEMNEINILVSGLEVRRFAISTEANAGQPIGVRKSRLLVPLFMWIHEEQHIPQNVTHSLTFPCIAIASASLGLLVVSYIVRISEVRPLNLLDYFGFGGSNNKQHPVNK